MSAIIFISRQLSLTKKIFLGIIMMLQLHSAFADNENYDGQDVSGKDFSGKSHKNSSWVSSTASGTIFSTSENATSYSNSDFTSAYLKNANFTDAILSNTDFTDAIVEGANFNYSSPITSGSKLNTEQLYSTASYKNKNLTGCGFANIDLTKCNFTGINLTNVVFTATRLAGCDFTDAIIEGASFAATESKGFDQEQLYSTASYKNKNLTGIKFGHNYMVGFDFTGQNMTNVSFWGAELNNVDFTNANLTNVNFKNADINDADFDNAIIEGAYFTDITTKQLYRTASYKEKNLKGVTFSVCLDGADFTGQNLMNANFVSLTLTDADFTKADLRGGTMKSNYVITKNTIMGDGRIKDFSMVSSDDSFSIRKYTPAAEGGEMISAKIGEDATISGGAELALENGAELEVIDAASLSVANGSSIIINTDTDSSTKVLIASDAALEFEAGSILSVNIECDEAEYEALQVSIMDFEDGACITGLNALVKGETILLSVNDSEWLGDWDYSIENNQMLISIIPEPATVAAILGALALTFVIRYKKGHRKNEI